MMSHSLFFLLFLASLSTPPPPSVWGSPPALQASTDRPAAGEELEAELRHIFRLFLHHPPPPFPQNHLITFHVSFSFLFFDTFSTPSPGVSDTVMFPERSLNPPRVSTGSPAAHLALPAGFLSAPTSNILSSLILDCVASQISTALLLSSRPPSLPPLPFSFLSPLNSTLQSPAIQRSSLR